MARFWIITAAAVAVIAALKTALFVAIAVPDASATVVTALFLAFNALTGLAGLAVWQIVLRHGAKAKRLRKATALTDTPIAKESVIAEYAQNWGLSRAEADVAIFVAKGFSNNEIADMRGCALATVKSQLTRIYAKSGLESRYQLIAFVTDEVVTATRNAQNSQAKRATSNILPLVGRLKPTDDSQNTLAMSG
ncbi:helix-turn-helix transcriptional regulator [Sagittula sp. SSi028]|uniref:helix-turn-helix transcriptional regulator n=1 Tax=Sagittula sp. SSi028 TaxID=3400636 RepID=UPI003AF97575